MFRTIGTMLLIAGLSVSCAATRQMPVGAPLPPGLSYQGPDHVSVDLLRTYESATRIFVQARLPDGEYGLFLVDTGAAISALSEETATRLGLTLDRNFGSVQGLGGTSNFDRAVIPTIAFGDAVISDVDVAVGVRGIPEYAYFMPLDGILGNNVWSRFVLEVDYPSDTLSLHRPGTVKVPGNVRPMHFDGAHVLAPIGITTTGKPPFIDELVMEIDTGAGELILSGASGRAFESSYTQGVEPIYGIGANEYLPASMYLQKTRRIPVAEVELGGKRIRKRIEAKWLNFDQGQRIGPKDMRGLIGHELLSQHVAWFDYQGSRFSLVNSRKPKRQINGHQVLLDQDIERFGTDSTRDLYRAKMYFAVDDEDRAVRHLESFLDAHPDNAEARELLAKVRRLSGDLAGAWQALASVSPGGLVDENEIIASVNGLLLDSRLSEAHTLATQAIQERPDEADAHIALADVLISQKQYVASNQSLLEAARLLQNPDANLLRRARVSLAGGDRHGALAKVRRLLKLYPTEGVFLWFYATLLTDDLESDMFEIDMKQAIARLHPGLRPLDFMVAAHRTLGDDMEVADLMKSGIERDCSLATDRPSKDNCYAWYLALAGKQTAEALVRIERALEEEGDRSDFLDTRAMVHLARGELVQAHLSAVAAARLDPDDVYMLWQAERIADMIVDAGR